MIDYILRTAELNEIENLLKIVFQAFNRPIPADIKDQEKLLIDLIRNEMAHFVILLLDNRICGLGGAFFFEKVCSFGYMAVLKEYRNRGIGTKIFSSLMEYAKHKNCETFTLYASKLGEPIYKKFGFQARFYETMYNLPKELNMDTLIPKKIRMGDKLPKWAINLDIKAVGFDRSKYLNIVIKHGSTLLLIENEGYALISGARIGPLIAKNLETARILIRESVLYDADHIIIPKHSKLPIELFNVIELTVKAENKNRMMIKGKKLQRNLEYFYALGTYAKG